MPPHAERASSGRVNASRNSLLANPRMAPEVPREPVAALNALPRMSRITWTLFRLTWGLAAGTFDSEPPPHRSYTPGAPLANLRGRGAARPGVQGAVGAQGCGERPLRNSPPSSRCHTLCVRPAHAIPGAQEGSVSSRPTTAAFKSAQCLPDLAEWQSR